MLTFSDIPSGILFYISSDILSDILCDILHSQLRSRSAHWIWLSQLRSGSAHCALAHAVEVRQAAPLIKSRDPHLPVGEKHHKGRNQQEPVLSRKKTVHKTCDLLPLGPICLRYPTGSWRASPLPLEPWPNVFWVFSRGCPEDFPLNIFKTKSCENGTKSWTKTRVCCCSSIGNKP